jgi:ubiquitin carboxyl-terminal hydrolase 22/27/51
MSVILQSFIHNPLLRNFYLGDGHRTGNCTQEDCLNCGMDELFQDFYAQDTTAAYAASNLLSISWQAQQKTYSKLVGDDENDAHEYFQFLTEELHQTSKAPWSNSTDCHSTSGQSEASGPCNCIVHQTFYGSLQSTVTCQHCGAITTSIQPFLDLSLGLANIVKKRAGKLGKGGQKAIQSLTLQKCLDTEYLQPEQCDYTCHSCHSTENKGRKQSAIKRLPNVLCIQFKVSGTFLKVDLVSIMSCADISRLSASNTTRKRKQAQNSGRKCSSRYRSICYHIRIVRGLKTHGGTLNSPDLVLTTC